MGLTRRSMLKLGGAGTIAAMLGFKRKPERNTQMAFGLVGLGNAAKGGALSVGKITVPEGEYWRVTGVELSATASATGGTRLYSVQFYDPTSGAVRSQRHTLARPL